MPLLIRKGNVFQILYSLPGLSSIVSCSRLVPVIHLSLFIGMHKQVTQYQVHFAAGSLTQLQISYYLNLNNHKHCVVTFDNWIFKLLCFNPISVGVKNKSIIQIISIFTTFKCNKRLDHLNVSAFEHCMLCYLISKFTPYIAYRLFTKQLASCLLIRSVLTYFLSVVRYINQWFLLHKAQSINTQGGENGIFKRNILYAINFMITIEFLKMLVHKKGSLRL